MYTSSPWTQCFLCLQSYFIFLLCSVHGGQWRSALAHQRLMNTTRMCSRLLCRIRLCHHLTSPPAKSRRSLLQPDLQPSHNHHSQQHNLSRRSGHVSSTECQSHTHTGLNIHMDQSGMPAEYRSLGIHFYIFFGQRV
jgi:hypothetical protein